MSKKNPAPKFEAGPEQDSDTAERLSDYSMPEAAQDVKGNAPAADSDTAGAAPAGKPKRIR